MKYWEVIKAIDEGTKDMFLHESGDDPVILLQKKYVDGWNRVKAPVTWQEAIEAAMQGRKVEFFLEGFTYKFHKESEICPKHIEAAAWYIED